MTNKEIEQLFSNSGAFLQGHFLYASKMHGPIYIEKFRALENPKITSELCSELIKRAPAKHPRVVLGPMTGGALLAFEVARQIGALSFFLEKMDGILELRRGFKIESGDEVWITEDVVNLGGSISSVVECVEQLGAKIGAILILVDRSKGRVKFDVPVVSLFKIDNLVEYKPEECPLCQQGIPLTALGGRKVDKDS